MPVHMRGNTWRRRVCLYIETCLVEFETPSNFLDGPDHRSEQTTIKGGRIQDGANVLLGDDNYVDLGFRLWVVKSQYEIILPYFSHFEFS